MEFLIDKDHSSILFKTLDIQDSIWGVLLLFPGNTIGTVAENSV